MEKDIKLLQAEVIRTRSEIGTIDTDIDDINTDIVHINADIDTLNERVTTVQTGLAATDKAVAAVRDDVIAVETKNTEQDTSIKNLETTSATHTTEIAAAKSDIAAIKTKNTAQDSSISNLETTTAEHTTDISKLKESTNKNASDIVALQTFEDDAQNNFGNIDATLDTLTLDVSDAHTRIDTLEIKEDERAHFLGAFQTTAELLAFPTPTKNDFADNYQTATRWIYNTSWADTHESMPTDATILGNVAPKMDGNASAGIATLASRVDHVHPNDRSRVPTTRKVNNKVLSADITLAAADVGAVPTNRTVNAKPLSANIVLAATDVGAVPTTRLVNNKALSSDIALTAADVGAVPTARTVNGKALSADIALNAADVGAVPTTRTVNNKALSADITLAAADVGISLYEHNIITRNTGTFLISNVVTILNSDPTPFTPVTLFDYLIDKGFTSVDTRKQSVGGYAADGWLVGMFAYTDDNYIGHVKYNSTAGTLSHQGQTITSLGLTDIVTKII